ncbi:regulator of chromosome condensation 1/beta-lactamase-inhibitor protein II, partial [Pelagophyceae sp. CCMP2097]
MPCDNVGNEHTLTVNRAGRVFAAGFNDSGQCGRGNETETDASTLQVVDALTPASSVHASNGAEHSLVLLRDGRLAAFGCNARGQLGSAGGQCAVPRFVALGTRRVLHVASSYHHTLVACEGAVFGFGRNDVGQLGVGDFAERTSPAPLESLRLKHVSSISCGQYHSCAVSDGALMACGRNDYGQAGKGSEIGVVCVFTSVDEAAYESVACGYYHAVAVRRDGRIVGFGRNDSGQLGFEKTVDAPAKSCIFGPRLLDPWHASDKVATASCGSYHTAVVTTAGRCLVFGRNGHGQLGLGDHEDRFAP